MTTATLDLAQGSAPATTVVETGRLLGGAARFYRLPEHSDARGALLAMEFDALPFAPRRAFMVHGVPTGTARGGHAHARGQQLLVCLSGEVTVELRLRDEIEHVRMARHSDALLIEAGVWARQTYLDDAVLLVLASEPYDAASYQHTPA